MRSEVSPTAGSNYPASEFPELAQVDATSWSFAAQFIWQALIYTPFFFRHQPVKRWGGFVGSLRLVAHHEALVQCALANEPDDDRAVELLDRLDARYDEIMAARERKP